jgi:hypothetical protein
MGKARIMEQAIPKGQLPQVLRGRGRNWGDRFSAGPDLSRWRLCDGQLEGAKADGRRKTMRDDAARSEGGRGQSQDEAQGPHGQFNLK